MTLKAMNLKLLLGRIFKILTPDERRRWRRAMLAVAGNTLLDFFGIASLLPLLYYLLSDGDNRKAAILFGGLAITFIIAKSITGIYLQRYRTRYLSDLFSRLSHTLFRENFSRGIVYIRNHGTGRIGYEITWVCHTFCQNILGTLMSLTGDILLLLLIGGAVVAMAPVSALILCIPLLTVAVAFRKFAGEKARREGDRELEGRRRQTRVINDTFGGFSDVMVSGAFPALESDFKGSLRAIAESRLKVQLYNSAVLPLCEAAVAVSLALMVLAGAGTGTKMALGLFAVAAFRVIPAIRGIIWGWIQIKNASGSLEIIEKSESMPPGPLSRTKRMPLNESLLLRDISFRYPGDERPILMNFSCRVDKGGYAGFKGESGIGKSTLFNIILGLIAPDSGEVVIDGTVLSEANKEDWLETIGYVPQDVYVFNASVAANVALGVEDPDRDRIMEVLREAKMDEWLENLSEGIDTVLGERGLTLSGGERQRLGLARALYRDISLLLLDEATSALDSDTESEIIAAVEEARLKRGLTVLSIAHRESSLSKCTQIIDLST